MKENDLQRVVIRTARVIQYGSSGAIGIPSILADQFVVGGTVEWFVLPIGNEQIIGVRTKQSKNVRKEK
jgi:hypothetical protein